MKARLTVEVPNEFLEEVAQRMNEDAPDETPHTALDLFTGRCQDVADDELRHAFYTWPIEVTVEIEP